jgi:hypothetical protein
VIYQARLPLYFYGDGFDNGKSGGKEVRPKVSVSSSFIGSNNNSQKLFLNSLRDSIEFIAKTNKSLFIILPSFSNGWDPLQRLVSMEKSKLSFEEAQDLLSISIDRVEKRVGLIRALLEKISQEHENITVINPNDIFCSELSCSPITSDGKLLFTDADHFSLDVNNAILNKIFESLNEELR